MIYPDSFIKKTGFDLIILKVQNLCYSEMGKALAVAEKYSDSFSVIQHKLLLVSEFKDILDFGKSFPSQDYYNLIPELTRISTEGTFIDPEQIALLRLSYQTIHDVKEYFFIEQEKYSHLYEHSKKTSEISEIIGAINQILDEEGNIKDNASENLKKIRASIKSSRQLIEKRINQIFISLQKEGVVDDNVEMTMRNGRCVIPVASANKKKLKGFIHDESSSGQTVFIEPSEIFELNNNVRELENEEKKEIIKILKKFTDFIRPFVDGIIKSYEYLGEIDYIRAKAQYAVNTHSVNPKLFPYPLIQWSNAINPLLEEHLKTAGKKVVPVDITLDNNNRILVISGPNAGGKSICLKTTGLLQYMLQSGYLIPLDENSKCGVFSDILIEIGDEQSIENDLSTYSSHLKNIKFFVENTSPKSLFLIDEFGSGTDPLMGAAIAEAVLLNLNRNKSFGIVSTHYSNLKDTAANTQGMINGAMLFDVGSLTPLYKLIQGKSGSSYAFEIAEKTGLASEIISDAVKLYGEEKISFEKQWHSLEREKEEIIQQKERLRIADEFFSEMIDKYQNIIQKLEKDKKQIIEQARNEAILLIKNTNAVIEKTIKQIRESSANKQITNEARSGLKQFEKKISAHISVPETRTEVPYKKKPEKKIIEKIPEKKINIPFLGSHVTIKGQNVIGEIAEIKNDMALVVYGNIKISIPILNLEVVEKQQYEKHQKQKNKNNYSEIFKSLQEKVSDYKTTIDIRGKRAEEIYPILEKQIDNSVLLSIYEFRIIHGKGTGVLRKVVREILAAHPDVISFHDELTEDGSDGVTIVKLK